MVDNFALLTYSFFIILPLLHSHFYMFVHMWVHLEKHLDIFRKELGHTSIVSNWTHLSYFPFWTFNLSF